MALFDFHRFTLTFSDGSTKQVYPVNNIFTYTLKKDEDYKIYRTTADSTLRFKGDDFQCIYDNLEGCGCSEVELLVERCCGGAWFTIFNGLINKYNSVFNESLCFIESKPDPLDGYTDLLACWEKETNILTAPNKVTINFVPSGTTFVQQSCGSVTSLSVPPGFDINNEDTYRLVDNYQLCGGVDPNIFYPVRNRISTNDSITYSVATWHNRLTTVVNCSGGVLPNVPANWFLFNNDCANGQSSYYIRMPNTAITSHYIESQNDTTGQFVLFLNHYAFSNGVPFPIDNGVTLQDTLQTLLDGCDFDGEIISDFFGINPTGDCPDNLPYQYAADCLQNLVLFQKTDVMFPSVSQNATVGKLKLKDFIDNLIELFNVCFWITEDGNFRIEHVSCRQLTDGLDLEALNPKLYAGSNTWDYEDAKTPSRETFDNMEASNEDFAQGNISYKRVCRGRRGEVVERNTPVITTDILHVLSNPDEISDNGFVLVALKEYAGDLLVSNEIGLRSGEPQYNAPLSWSNLLPNLWTYDRYDSVATINGSNANIETLKRDRKQPINATLSCSEILSINPNDLINTGLGKGEIDSMKVSSNCKVEFILNHNCNE